MRAFLVIYNGCKTEKDRILVIAKDVSGVPPAVELAGISYRGITDIYEVPCQRVVPDRELFEQFFNLVKEKE